ncbi:hypothetical protein VTJ83DRAFT_3575 [Remersonia thermophila]|uniref:C3H1-type domain-containing protein n=1 Tax=Remersonia thermophila TaxID=72144 RepID=A0ABR4DFB0_9PEZI
MDQHLNGDAASWDLSGFGDGTWAPQHGNPGLGFGAGPGPGGGYSSAGLPQAQQSAANLEASLFPPLGYDEGNSINHWSDQGQASVVSYGQGPAVPQQTFGDHQVDNRLVSEAPAGYPQGPVHWGQDPTRFENGVHFDNPLAAAPAFAIDPQISNQGPGFLPPRGPDAASPLPHEAGFQQPAITSSRQHQPAFAVDISPAQQQQPRPPIQQYPAQPPFQQASQPQLQQTVQPQLHQAHQAQLQHTAQPQVQQVVQPQHPKGGQPQPQFQQVVQPQPQQPVQAQPQPVVQPQPQPAAQPQLQQTGQQPTSPLVQQPVFQPAAGQSLQSQPPIANGQTGQPFHPVQGGHAGSPGTRLNSVSEAQVPPAVAKKARALAPATPNPPAPSSQPLPASAPPPEPLGPFCTINHQDGGLLESAKERPELTWEGVPNLVIGSAPVTLQKGTPTKRYVDLKTRGGRDPLFPQLWRGWMVAEAIGNHVFARQNATSDIDIRRADIRFEVELKRASPDMPAEAYKKHLKDRNVKEGLLLQEPLETEILAEELLRRHPAHRDNQQVSNVAWGEYVDLLKTRAQELRDAQRRASGKHQDPGNGAEQQGVPLGVAKERLTATIAGGIRADAADLFPNMRGMDRLKVMFKNIFVNLINTGELNSPLAKALLELFALAKLTRDDLDALQMDKVRKRIEEKGDAEAQALIARVYENAGKEKNGGARQGDAASVASGTRGKKTTSAKAGDPSKQTGTPIENKTPASASASLSSSKSATSTTKSSNDKATSTSSKMPSNGDADKASSKPTTKVAAAAAGAKRPREADAAGAESRSSKKPATDAPSTGSTKASSLTTKAAATKPSTTPASAPAASSSSSSSAAPPTKPRSSLLLPGKVRTAAKPAVRSEPAKADEKNAAGQAEPATKTAGSKADAGTGASTASKTAKPKPADISRDTAPSKSRISALIETIEEDKKIRTPASHRQKEPSPPPSETPEQRQRRLRKESRRHLRVSFKSGDALVEIREFTREPEEIAEANKARLGRELYRTMNSEESEMMKRLHRGQALVDDEFEEREWESPSAIDFAGIPQEQRERTYVTRGGLKTFETEEQQRTRERERNELMVIYHNREDIPPSPRSPLPTSSAGEHVPSPISLGPQVPRYEELMRRRVDFSKWGAYHAARAALHRADNPPTPFHHHSREQGSAAHSDPRTWYDPAVAAKRDQATFELLSSDRVRSWRDPDPANRTYRRMTDEELAQDARLQEVLANLRAIAATIPKGPRPVRQEAAPTQVAPAPMPAAVTAHPVQTAAPDYSAAWAQYYASQQQQQQQQQQQGWYTQQQHQQPQPAPGNDQVAGILATLGIQQPAGQPVGQPVVQGPNQQVEMLLKAFTAANPGQVPDPQQVDMLLKAVSASPAQAVDPQQVQHLLSIARHAATGQQPAQYGHQHPYYSQAGPQGYNPPQGYAPPQADREGYGSSSHGYSQPQQERDAYGQAYGGGGADRDRERENGRERDGYGRERDRERDRDHRGHRERGRGNGGDGAGRNLVGTKACMFWAKGKCAKGDKCTFRHD